MISAVTRSLVGGCTRWISLKRLIAFSVAFKRRRTSLTHGERSSGLGAQTVRVLAGVSWKTLKLYFEQILSISLRKLASGSTSGTGSSNANLDLLDLISRRRSFPQLILFSTDCSATKPFFSSAFVPARRALREMTSRSPNLSLVPPLATSCLPDFNASSVKLRRPPEMRWADSYVLSDMMKNSSRISWYGSASKSSRPFAAGPEADVLKHDIVYSMG